MGFFNIFSRILTKEEKQAYAFLEDALSFINSKKGNLLISPRLKPYIQEKEFNYWSVFVAIRAAEAGAIMKFGIEDPISVYLLRIILKDFKKINPHVEQNFQYNKSFIDDLVEHGRLTNDVKSMPEAYGFWILYSLKAATLEFTDPDIIFASKTIGEWLCDKYVNYWDAIG